MPRGRRACSRPTRPAPARHGPGGAQALVDLEALELLAVDGRGERRELEIVVADGPERGLESDP
jgi:hypothetical protein